MPLALRGPCGNTLAAEQLPLVMMQGMERTQLDSQTRRGVGGIDSYKTGLLISKLDKSDLDSWRHNAYGAP